MRIMSESFDSGDQIRMSKERFVNLLEENRSLKRTINELKSVSGGNSTDNKKTALRTAIHQYKDFNPGNSGSTNDDSKDQDRSSNDNVINEIYERSSLGIFRISQDGMNNFANSALYKLLGVEKNLELLYNSKNRWLPSVPALIRYLEKYNYCSSDKKCSLNRMYIRPDGEKIYLNVSIQRCLNEANMLEYYEGIVEDITIQKTARETLVKAKEEAEKSDRLKTEFLSQMSHEIRTPINTLLNFVSLIEDEMRCDNYENLDVYFESVHKSGNRIVRTMDLILNMSEIRSGTYEYSKKKYDVYKDVLKGLYSDFSKAALKKNIKLRFINENVSPMVYGDKGSIQNILTNLIDNAIKYTHSGEVVVKVTGNINSNVVVEVKDTGIGISQEYLKTLFSPFSQEEQGYTRKFDGNGLGLALSFEYAQINNAKIHVSSVKGEGSIFRVVFQ